MAQVDRRRVPIEIRAEESGRLTGYLLRWEELSTGLRWFRERFRRGAFAESLASRAHDIVALWSHDATKPLASRDAGTLEVSEDEIGPAFSFTPAATSWGRDAVEAVRSGLVRAMSFGFEAIDADWELKDGEEIRTVTRADLYEISPVIFPAYDSGSVEARSVEEVWKRHLAEAGAASGGEKRQGQIDLLLAINQMKGRALK